MVALPNTKEQDSLQSALRVLVVDDDPLIHVIFQKVAAKVAVPLRVESAMLGAEGLQKMKEFKPDMVFLDINMPGMSGWDVLEAMGPAPENCRIFVFSSSIDPQDQRRARSYASVNDYVVKPITIERLAGLV